MHWRDRIRRHQYGRAGGPQIFMIWGDSFTPAVLDSEDPSAVTLGCKFRSDVPGEVIGVRFYKGDADNGGVHQGQLWDSVGNLLNSVTFVGETASGWQQQLFAAPTPITANTTYIISYFAPQGHYSDDQFYFQGAGHDNPPLHALQDGLDGGNGVFDDSGAPAFPANTFRSTNYWVDVVFQT